MKLYIVISDSPAAPFACSIFDLRAACCLFKEESCSCCFSRLIRTGSACTHAHRKRAARIRQETFMMLMQDTASSSAWGKVSYAPDAHLGQAEACSVAAIVEKKLLLST